MKALKKLLSVFLSFVILISVTSGINMTAWAKDPVYEEGDIKIYQYDSGIDAGGYYYYDGKNHVTSFQGKNYKDYQVDLIRIGETTHLYPDSPPYSSGYTITNRRWSSNDPSIACFYGSSFNPATVMGRSPGETIITSEFVWIWSNQWQTDSGTAVSRDAVRVVGWFDEVTLSDSQLTLSPGQSKTISVTSVKPDDVFTRFFNKLHFVSKNPDIATVDDNGNIKAVATGTTDIFVYSNYSETKTNEYSSCKVTVAGSTTLSGGNSSSKGNSSSASTSQKLSSSKKTSIKSLKRGRKQFRATWKKVSGVSGYQLQYSTDKNFKKNKKTVTVKKSKTTSKTVKKLKSKKKYYVRIRTYKTVNGKKLYSSWSKVKTVKVK